MNIKLSNLCFVFLIALLAQGCAGVASKDPLKDNPYRIVPIHETEPQGVRFKLIQKIELVVKKETLFDREPTVENVNLKLEDKARQLGADAVINVKYEKLTDEQDWSYIKSSGDAVLVIR